jgi:hypothetical protein
MIRIFGNKLGNALALANLALFILADVLPAARSEALELLTKLNSPALLVERFLMGEFAIGIITWPLIYFQWLSIGRIAKWAAGIIERKLTELRLK